MSDPNRVRVWTDVRAEIERECDARHPIWLSRLETDRFYPIALIRIADIEFGDIIDLREFRIPVEEPASFIRVDVIQKDSHGVYGLAGMSSDGNVLEIGRSDGKPITRRRVVRFGRRMPI